jgi:hypothetical protein
MRGSNPVLPRAGPPAARASVSDIQRPTRIPSRNTSPSVGPLDALDDGVGASPRVTGAMLRSASELGATGVCCPVSAAGAGAETGARTTDGAAGATRAETACESERQRAGGGAATGRSAASDDGRVGATIVGAGLRPGIAAMAGSGIGVDGVGATGTACEG